MAKSSKTKTKEIGEVKERKITEEMKESYIDYAMSVIISRALPDVRDGLKPVHRRILYAMYEDRLLHNASFRKSATVVGACLSRYHPHGDVAVYNSLARMTQDFSLRYPLTSGQGNWGSIDDPSEFAAMRYCITGDSMIVTDRCLEKVGEVSDKEDISLKVLSMGKKVNQASKWFDSGIHPVLQIKTHRGYSLRGTFNHPILTLVQNQETGKPNFKWKLLENIEKGDFAVIDRSDTFWPEKEPSLKKYFPERERKDRAFVYNLPSKMNQDLAFLMGAITAEGYISIGKKSGAHKIGFCNTDKEFLDGFRKRFKNLFPNCKIYEQKRDSLSYGKKEFVSFEICSKYLVEFLKNLGLQEVLSDKKRVPEIIFHSSKKSVAEFLKGYFEGDGGVYQNVDSGWIEASSASGDLFEEIQNILLRFGIVCSVVYNQKRKEFKLLIRGYNNLGQFREKINFLSKRNKNKLKKFSRIYSGTAISKTDYIPFLSRYIRKKYKKKEINPEDKKYLRTHNLDRYSKLKKYFPYLKKILDKSDIELIENFLENHYLFDSIVSIKKKSKERVYSLRIDSSCHSFVSNGFISHNTETKLSKIGEEMLRDIKKDTVDFEDNYDGTRQEPVVLPSPVPQLLLNGALGIAVGMATKIPPHNLSEVCDACCFLIENPEAETSDLFKFIKGPDFPTGGMIFDKKEIISAYSQGKGKIVMRAKTNIEKKKGGGAKIIITEIPYQVQKTSLISKMAKLVSDKKIKGIKDIKDLSDREGMRIEVTAKKGSNPRRILNRLYKFTNLQKNFYLNMLAIVDGIQPKILSLTDVLSYFIAHRKEVVKRRTKFELEKAKDRAHILEGLSVALKNIDDVIATIKKSANRDKAKKNLKKKFELSNKQAEAILQMRLQALAKLEREKIEKEFKELKKKIKKLKAILKSKKKIKEIVKKELKEVKEKYGDKRKTKVKKGKIKRIKEADLVPLRETIITLTKGGYVKRIKPGTYKIQRRGGKGIIGMKTRKKDIVEHFVSASTHDKLLFFTDSGKVFQTKVYEIPKAKRVARGRGLVNFLDLSTEENVLSLIPLKKQEEKGIKYLVMVTKNGKIKKTSLDKFQNVRRTGIRAIKLRKGDLVRGVIKTTGKDQIILITKKGKSIRFKEQQVRSMGRATYGVKGIKLKKGDEIIGIDVIHSADKKKSKKKEKKSKKGKKTVLVVTESGYGKRTPLSKYRTQKRGGVGIKTANINKKTGQIVIGKVLSSEEKDLIVISRKGQVIRVKIDSISIHNRATQGVRIMRLKEGDKVASGTCI